MRGWEGCRTIFTVSPDPRSNDLGASYSIGSFCKSSLDSIQIHTFADIDILGAVIQVHGTMRKRYVNGRGKI
jgi:hypothetical protein